jgi:hypothetical protein
MPSPQDDDGFITFEEFIISYARPKPILKNLLIMAINTAVIYFVLQAPFLDTMIKVGLELMVGCCGGGCRLLLASFSCSMGCRLLKA